MRLSCLSLNNNIFTSVSTCRCSKKLMNLTDTPHCPLSLIRRMKLIFSHRLLLQFSRSLLKSRRKDSWARSSCRRRETAAEDEWGYCFIWLSKPGLIWGLSGEGTCVQAWWKLFRGEKRVGDCIKSLVALIEKPFSISLSTELLLFLSLSLQRCHSTG